MRKNVIVSFNMKTEHEECRKTAKRSKRGNLQDECNELENQRRTVKRSNSKRRRTQKLKPLVTK